MMASIETTTERWWQLRVELMEVESRAWRRVIVPESITLAKLHRVLQMSMGWTNGHPHEFIVNGIRYGVPDPDWSLDQQQVDEERVTLQNVLGRASRCFDYVYSFADDWHHVVILEDAHVSPSRKEIGIQCIAGENACPPENVGGPHGYAHFIGVVTDPTHPEYADCVERVGGFDPAKFDIASVQRSFARTRN